MRQNILVTILWGISLATSFEVSLSLWGFAIVLDLFTPFLYQRVLSAPAARLSKTHLPERFGLFYILVLGECVNAAIGPLTQSDSVVSSSLIFTCIIGLAMAFGVWWLYFNNLDEDVTLHSIKSLGVWELSHFVLGFSTLMLAHCLYFGLITNLPANEWKYLPFVTGGSLGMVLVCLGTLHTVCYLNNPTVVGLRQLRGRFAGAIVIIVMGFLDMKSMTHFFSYVIVLALLIALDSFFERTQKA